MQGSQFSVHPLKSVDFAFSEAQSLIAFVHSHWISADQYFFHKCKAMQAWAPCMSESRPRLHVWGYMTCPTKKILRRSIFFLSKQTAPYVQTLWLGASAYGSAPKHVGQEEMPDRPPCL